MKSPFNYLVHCENRYNNKVDVDGSELILNTEVSENDFRFTNRIGTIKSVPSAYPTPIKEGDEVIVHHNVFRRYYDVKGVEKDSSAFISDNIYLVSEDQIFGYKRDNTWHATEGYVFIEPVDPESIWETSGETQLKGVLVITSDRLDHLIGHTVGFTPNSEYEFNIDGNKVYRILSNHITIDYDSKRKKSKNNRLEPESA